MLINTTISAWSIFIALIGVSVNAVVTRPYTRISYITPMKDLERNKCKEKIGIVANIFIVIGTLGQLLSILLHF
jgi:hypothetical protein